MRHLLVMFGLLGALPLAGCRTADLGPRELAPYELGDTRNVHAMGSIITAGQPDADSLARARDLGVRTVYNLRRDEEMAQVDLDEAAEVARLGMVYVHHPWSGAAQLTDARLDAARAVFRDAARPMLVHCASANRVGAVWAAWRALDDGIEVEAALAEGREIGLRTEAYAERVREYVAARR